MTNTPTTVQSTPIKGTKEYLVNLISIISKNSINAEEYLYIKNEFKTNAKEIDYEHFIDLNIEKYKMTITKEDKDFVLSSKNEYDLACVDQLASKEDKIEKFLIIDKTKENKKKTALPGLVVDKYEYDISLMPKDVIERFQNVLLNTAYYAVIGFNDPFVPAQNTQEMLKAKFDLKDLNEEQEKENENRMRLYSYLFLQNVLVDSFDEFKKSIVYERKDVGDGKNPFANVYKQELKVEDTTVSSLDDFDF